MAKHLRPRRGKKSTAESQKIVLQRGEVFFECPDTGVGTGAGKIKVGDGVTEYANLPYFVEPGSGSGDISDSAVTFTENTSTSNTTLLNTIATGASLKVITGAVKKMLSNLNSSYFPKTGGTIEGDTLDLLKVKRTSSNSAVVGFENSVGVLGYIGMNAVDGGLRRISSDAKKGYNILDENNMGNYVVPKTGGEYSGNITAKNISGTLLQSTANNASSTAKSKICVQDDNGWIYTRTNEQILGDIGAAAADHEHQDQFVTTNYISDLAGSESTVYITLENVSVTKPRYSSDNFRVTDLIVFSTYLCRRAQSEAYANYCSELYTLLFLPKSAGATFPGFSGGDNTGQDVSAIENPFNVYSQTDLSSMTSGSSTKVNVVFKTYIQNAGMVTVMANKSIKVSISTTAPS